MGTNDSTDTVASSPLRKSSAKTNVPRGFKFKMPGGGKCDVIMKGYIETKETVGSHGLKSLSHLDHSTSRPECSISVLQGRKTLTANIISDGKSLACFEVPLDTVLALSAGDWHPYKPVKLVFACRRTITGTLFNSSKDQAAIVKIWLPDLITLEQLLTALRPYGVMAKRSAVPSILHTPELLHLYRPWLLTALVNVIWAFHVVAAFSFVIFLENLLMEFPDVGIVTFSRFSSVLRLWYSSHVVGAQWWVQLLGLTCSGLFAIIAAPFLLLPAAVLLSMALARKSTAVLISFSLIQNFELLVMCALKVSKALKKVTMVVKTGKKAAAAIEAIEAKAAGTSKTIKTQ